MAVGLFPLLCGFMGTLYPAYASFKALESPDADDDRQWLTYWVIFSTMTLVESLVAFVTWIWGYYVIKALFLLYLIAPQTQGALKIYQDLVRPLLHQHASKIDPIFAAGTMALKLPCTGAMAQLVESQGPGAVKSLGNVVFNGPLGSQLAQLAQQSPELLENLLQQAVASANTQPR